MGWPPSTPTDNRGRIAATMLRILLADDHQMIRQGLRQILEAHTDWQVCAEASTGRQAVELALKLRPQVVVLDLAMPELNGLEATRQIKKALPNTEVLIFTVHETEELTRDVLAAGARAYLLKSDASRQIVAAVEALAEHKPYFTWKVSKTMLDAYLKHGHADSEKAIGFNRLTAREREIVQLLAEGRSNKAVSALLGISVKTVETHRAAVMKKLGINSIAELVRYAIRNSVIEA
jgi:DNA-binding NarL/FixJ family response regulator